MRHYVFKVLGYVMTIDSLDYKWFRYITFGEDF